MRCKIILFATFIFFSFQFAAVVSVTCQYYQLFPTCFFDEVLSLDGDEDSCNFNHLFLHPVKLLNHSQRSLIYQGVFEDIYHQKRGGENYHEIWFKNHRIAIMLPLEKTCLNTTFAFCFADEQSKLKFSLDKKYNFSFSGKKNLAQFIFAKRVFPHFLQIGLSVRTMEFSDRRLWDYSLEFVISPFDRLKFGLIHRNQNMNSFLDFDYEDSFMDLPVNLLSEESDLHFSFDLKSGFQFNSEYQETKLKGNQKLSHQTDYLLDPRGDGFSFSNQLTLRLTPELQLDFGQKKECLKSASEIYYLNQKFGKITSLELSEEGIFGRLSFEKKNKRFFSSEIEVLKMSGEGKGHVETWPFTPTLVDLLGQRLYFRLNGDAKVLRWGMEYYGSELHFLFSRIRISIDYLCILPSLKTATWNPVFLVFGIRNLKESYLEYQRIDGLFIKLGFDYALKNLSLGYNFFQFLPIHTKTRRIDNEKPSEHAPANVLKKSTGGGRTHLISLYYQLP